MWVGCVLVCVPVLLPEPMESVGMRERQGEIALKRNKRHASRRHIGSLFGCLLLMAIPMMPIAYFLAWFLLPCTQYSPDYEEKAFQQIEVGMPMSEVYDIAGEPIRRVTPWRERWQYDGFQVCFDDDGKVMTGFYSHLNEEYVSLDMGSLPEALTQAGIKGLAREDITDACGAPNERKVGMTSDN